MRTRDENFLTMAHTVNEVVQRNQSQWGNAERFAQSAQELKDLVDFTVDVNASADSNIKGAAQAKEALCNEAINEGVKLAKRAKVYAKDRKDMELQERFNISAWVISDKHDTEVLATLKDWVARLTPVVGDLAPYGILPANLSHFKKLVDDFDTILTRPRELIVSRKTMNQVMLPDLLNKTRDVLESMDNLINLFENTPFESDYLNARKIVNLGGRKDDDEDEEKPEPPVA